MTNLTVTGPPKEKPKNYFGKLKFILKLNGISLDGNEGLAYKIYSFCIIVFLQFLYPALDFLELFKHDFDEVATMTTYIFGTSLGFIKGIVTLQHRNQLRKLLDRLEQEPFLPNPSRGGEEEDKLISECVSMITVQNLFYWISALVGISVNVLASLIKRLRSNDYHDWEFPYGPFTVLNVTYSPNYEISLFYQVVGLTSDGLNFMNVDLLIAGVLAHICYQFKILQNNIRRLVLNGYEEMLKEENLRESMNLQSIEGSTIPWKYLKKSLIQAVDYHLAILDLAEEVETTFSSLLLTVFLSTLGLVCFIVFHMLHISAQDPQMWTSALEGVCAILQILLVCYWGQQVLHESQEVGMAAYETNFVGTDLRFQKSLALIMRRSQNPTTLTTGKFSVISLATFTWFLRTSYSAFTVLKTTTETN